MASTYSPLKIELIATGEQSGIWGTTTNTNLGTAIGEAITGSADVAFSSADVTVTLTDTNAAQTARNLRLNLTGTSGGARNLILGSGCQIEKLYLINNGLADAVTVKNTSGTGIAVPAGKTMFVYNNGTNVVDATTHLSSLTTGTLSASGATTFTAGTASTSTTTGTAVITGGLGVSGRINAANFDGIIGANTAAAGNFTTLSTTSFGVIGARTQIKGTNADITGATGSGTEIFGGSTPGILAFNRDGSVYLPITINALTVALQAEGTTRGLFSSSGFAVTGTLSATGVATFSAGTVSAPAITTTGDTNTGIFYPAADTIAFAEGGAEVMRIDSNGNVGINTTSPGVKLGVVDTSAGSATFPTIIGNRGTTVGTQVNFGLQTYDAGSAGITNVIGSVTTSATGGAGSADMVFQTTGSGTRAERMRIDSSGNVGIGTSSPTTNLQVAGTTKIGVTGTNGVLQLARTSDGATITNFKTDGTSGIIDSAVSTTFQINTAEAMRITSGGALCVGTTSATGSVRFIVESDTTTLNPMTVSNTRSTASTDYSILFYRNGSIVGSVQTSLSATSFVTSSDYRLKENIAPMTGALAKVAQLKPVIYTWKSDGSAGQGFIAHELQEVAPYAVSGEKDGEQMQGVDYGKITPLLTAALQEALAKIESLEARLAVLESK